jgi:hypothetical protein
MKNKTFKRIEKKAKVWRDLIANDIFVDYINERPLEETCQRIIKHRSIIIKLIAHLRQHDKKSSREFGVRYEHDFRTGDETYGYKSIQSIESNLNYISDRFCAEFRLTWLSEVPEKVELLKLK